METIVALATPPGNSGVAVIRISGQDAKEILQKMICENLNFTPRMMYLKDVVADNVKDNCLVVYFAAPNSFTGEDVVEIQSHGGYHLAQMIINQCIKYGARPALAGEFSKRAFLNGKMTLDQAEGIMDLINAETDLQASAGSKLLNGRMLEMVQNVSNQLTDILAETEAKLDYPEYEYTQAETTNTLNRLNSIFKEVSNFINTSVHGQVIKNGVKVALTGAPNVGKSSLLNALTETDKAIVTSIAGTTRDVIEGEYIYKGILFRMFDTAGIRESADEVESIGIKRALNAVKDADLVLKVFDGTTNYEVKTTKPTITIGNKSDINKSKDTDIMVSAKTGENIEKLKQLIFEKTVGEEINTNNFYLTNARHIECVQRALSGLADAIASFETTTLDIVSAQIKTAWHALGEITGVTSDEAIIDKIFSKFCLGK